jgi:hypothetical protein
MDDKRIESWLQVGMLVVAVIGILVVAVYRPPPIVPSVRAIIGRGPTVFVIRFPESDVERREQIVIREYQQRASELSRSYVVASDEREQRIALDLTNAQQAAWVHLRTQWCQQTPNSPDSSVIAFEIASRCPKPDGSLGRVVEFRIAPDQLPTELRNLIMMTSSPSCKDPLCGW